MTKYRGGYESFLKFFKRLILARSPIKLFRISLKSLRYRCAYSREVFYKLSVEIRESNEYLYLSYRGRCFPFPYGFDLLFTHFDSLCIDNVPQEFHFLGMEN